MCRCSAHTAVAKSRSAVGIDARVPLVARPGPMRRCRMSNSPDGEPARHYARPAVPGVTERQVGAVLSCGLPAGGFAPVYRPRPGWEPATLSVRCPTYRQSGTAWGTLCSRRYGSGALLLQSCGLLSRERPGSRAEVCGALGIGPADCVGRARSRTLARCFRRGPWAARSTWCR